MELFDKNFRRIRNDYVIPRISYGISRKKIDFWSLKNVMTDKLVSLNKLSGKSIEIELEPNIYYKAIHCDIELFMNKALVQYIDFKSQKNVSKSWSFISLYYFAFFSATCLFRILNKGFVFLSKEQTNKFEQFSIALYSQVISLESGNYYFNFKKVNSYGNVVLTLTAKGDSVHKSTWLQLETTLRDFSQLSNDNEKTLINFFLDHFSKFNTEYPSQLRNKLNYNGESSIHDLENSLPTLEVKNIDKSFFQSLAKLDSQNKNYENQMISVSYLASYLFEFNKKIHQEYIDRSGFGSDFKSERDRYFRERK